jgi:protein-S-isoprenylcysteine O-methyltransferase Ste14
MTSVADVGKKTPLNKYGYNTIARNMTMAVVACLPLFLVAGTWSWDWAWIYTVVSVIGWTLLNIIVVGENPALMNERGKRTNVMTKGAKRWDMILLSIYSLLLFATPIVAGLDYRNGWSTAVSSVIHILGIVLLAGGFIPLTWAMAANRFFAPAVMIQTERGHQVADNGPYHYVRHPGYVGIILHFLSVPIALGMWAALIPALVGVAIFVLRTALEDRTLQSELPGYTDYAKRTRYRLLPGIW